MYNYEIDVLKKKASEGSAVIVSMDKYAPDCRVAVSEHTSDSFSEYHSLKNAYMPPFQKADGYVAHTIQKSTHLRNKKRLE